MPRWFSDPPVRAATFLCDLRHTRAAQLSTTNVVSVEPDGGELPARVCQADVDMLASPAQRRGVDVSDAIVGPVDLGHDGHGWKEAMVRLAGSCLVDDLLARLPSVGPLPCPLGSPLLRAVQCPGQVFEWARLATAPARTPAPGWSRLRRRRRHAHSGTSPISMVPSYDERGRSRIALSSRLSGPTSAPPATTRPTSRHRRRQASHTASGPRTSSRAIGRPRSGEHPEDVHTDAAAGDHQHLTDRQVHGDQRAPANPGERPGRYDDQDPNTAATRRHGSARASPGKEAQRMRLPPTRRLYPVERR